MIDQDEACPRPVFFLAHWPGEEAKCYCFFHAQARLREAQNQKVYLRLDFLSASLKDGQRCAWKGTVES